MLLRYKLAIGAQTQRNRPEFAVIRLLAAKNWEGEAAWRLASCDESRGPTSREKSVVAVK